MTDLGPKQDFFGAADLVPIPLYRRPTELPRIPAGHQIICAFDRAIEVRMLVCHSLAEMQDLDERYAKGYAIKIEWFHGPDAGLLTPYIGDESPPQEP